MVGPFMQGLLLMGIIYWYSKSMMSMINDYYRGEFQRKLQAVDEAKLARETPLSVDNFMDYVRELDIKEQPKALLIERTRLECPAERHSQVLAYFMHITGAFALPDFCSSADSAIS